ncbi:hypothetical protein [Polymorphum gilvum]|uniref:Uncharacterized protein n=1 Tax=Polymorphum gilvum (strain LMG 25793 / CGMCC 1.9160 / SL003B-26A1) TaxID=991905 RepID=F2J6C7_POLGS|nr:hypothetical protein [Polymorphum gilvum]ADZ71301.1 hypothetical protein SL003B_2878 [Polymorphum gilvum SL003B-26A1]
MTEVSIALTGNNKENVRYVLLGGKRWGLNGEPYGTGQEVAAGDRDWTVDFPTTVGSGTITVPDQPTAVMTVDADDDKVTVSF